MKVTFCSDFLTPHQLPFCLEMQKKLGKDFKFVSTTKIFKWKLDLGFEDLDAKYDFVVRAYKNKKEKELAKELALDSDIVIMGSASDDLIEERLKLDRLTFRYGARVFCFPDGFRRSVFNKEKLKLYYNRHLKYRKNKNLYMLCANAYSAQDFHKLGLYKDKTFKWGYFIKSSKYDVDKLIAKKENNDMITLVWVARFIKLKNPEIVLKLAKNLKKQGYKFRIQMIGTGELQEKIEKQIKEKNLADVIEVIGSVPNDKVQDYMKKANIFIATSGHNEGWGVVVNEAMNSACAVVVNEQMGSAPYLIGEAKNKRGYMYKDYNDLEMKVKELLENKSLRCKLSKNAYNFITTKWTAKLASTNLIELFKSIINKRKCKVKEGPASYAE